MVPPRIPPPARTPPPECMPPARAPPRWAKTGTASRMKTTANRRIARLSFSSIRGHQDSRDGREALGADVARVQTSGDAHVGGAFDDRAAIRKYGEVVGLDLEAQGKLVGAHRAEWSQAHGELLQIERAGALVNLHRIAPAKADGGSRHAVQVHEIALPAGRTIAHRIGLRDLPDLAGPDIHGGDPPPRFLTA